MNKKHPIVHYKRLVSVSQQKERIQLLKHLLFLKKVVSEQIFSETKYKNKEIRELINKIKKEFKNLKISDIEVVSFFGNFRSSKKILENLNKILIPILKMNMYWSNIQEAEKLAKRTKT